METLITTIKFVAAGTGGGAATSSSTGDISFIIAAAIVMLIGACAVALTMYARKHSIVGAHVGNISAAAENKFAIPAIVAVTCAIVLSLCLIGAGKTKALADENGALTGGDEVIATVDPATGSVEFGQATITNSSDTTQEIKSFSLEAAESITTIDDVEWTIKIADTNVFEGTINQDVVTFDPITVAPGSKVNMTVSAKEISADLAKSLIGKDVAIAKSSYDAAGYTVSAIVDDSNHGSVTPTSIFVKPGTTYTAEASNNKITFALGTEEQTITFSPESGFKLDKWMLGDVEAESGTVTGDMTFTAKTTSTVVIKQVTNISYTGSSGSEQKVNFVPAFPDTNKTYLKNNGVEFYSDSAGTTVDRGIHDLIYSDAGCSMNELYTQMLVDPSAETKTVKTLYAKANLGVTFYGVLDETWDNVFSYSGASEGTATGLQETFKTWLNTNNLGTVYFDNEGKISSVGNWNAADRSSGNQCPTLNGVNYSNGGKGTSTFFEAYGDYRGGVLSRYSYAPWSSRAADDSDAYGWNILSGKWYDGRRGYDGGVVVSQAF